MKYAFRRIAGRAIAPILYATGFRFSKRYRHGITLFHRAVYASIDTIGANIFADSLIAPQTNGRVRVVVQPARSDRSQSSAE